MNASPCSPGRWTSVSAYVMTIMTRSPPSARRAPLRCVVSKRRPRLNKALRLALASTNGVVVMDDQQGMPSGNSVIFRTALEFVPEAIGKVLFQRTRVDILQILPISHVEVCG